ncbi:MAG: protein-L-isoaspartate(D-aspartate) O-methyltransferase [Planctomycetales bacterium]|nr:protein-L-isoaspartate(D-aspartate) O-methyltransferase [Planctomycetales bacterium]
MVHRKPVKDKSYAQERLWMVKSQIAARGIHDPRVLAAMEMVPREEFVPEELRAEAYEDGPLPIGRGQTISQPLTVAFMAQALQLTGEEKILEIGTGSGYGAAVLSCLAREVHTVERLPDLAEAARERLARLGFANVHVHVGDGSLGWPEQAPFHAICVTAAAASVPLPLQGQLSEGGRLVIPVGDSYRGQQMMRYTLFGCEFLTEELGMFSFVPLVEGQSSDEARQ